MAGEGADHYTRGRGVCSPARIGLAAEAVWCHRNTMNTITPFENCPALDGYHCVTSSLRKMFCHAHHPLSEDMLLGLGAGMGFIYWQMNIGQSKTVFVGGRGNTKNYFDDLGKRTGVRIKEVSTSSAPKARASLLEKLARKEPVMLFGDMGFLPWFDLPKDYHFGGHTFVVCGYDGRETVLASDLEQRAGGLKKGFYSPATLEQLGKARSSPFKPFPPKNTSLEFDFTNYHDPGPEDIRSSIAQAVESQLTPPIKNLGVKGIKHTAKEILKWPKMFDDNSLRMNLFSLYIFIEIGGTGGGCFRYMYSRFLSEAQSITGNKSLAEASAMFDASGKKFTEIGLLFKNAQQMDNIEASLQTASQKFEEIAAIEEAAYTCLKEC